MPARTVYTLLEETANAHGGKAALQQPTGGGKYTAYTWAEARDLVRWTALGLSTIGVKVGDIVALQSETRAEFYVADMGVMTAGAVSAALYTSLPFAEQAEAVRTCEARVVLVENAKAMRGLRTALGDAQGYQWIVLTGEAEGALLLTELIAKGRQADRKSVV